MVCDIPLEISQQGLQLSFIIHLNLRFANKVMGAQSCESPNFGKSGSPGTKCHLGVGPMAKHKVYYKGEGGGFLHV